MPKPRREYRPQLRWLYVPDTGYFLVLADKYDPVNRTVRILDLSGELQLRGQEVACTRLPAAALRRPLRYPCTLYGQWREKAWARHKILKEQRLHRLAKNGRAGWNPAEANALADKIAAQREKLRRRKFNCGKGLKHLRH